MKKVFSNFICTIRRGKQTEKVGNETDYAK